MNEQLYTAEEAAKKLGTSLNGVYQLAINGKLRMGVNARGWWGIWRPKQIDGRILQKVKYERTDIDENGRSIYSFITSEGDEIRLAEFYIHHFWYVEFNQLYELLTNREKAREVCFYEPTDELHEKLIDIEPIQVTDNGVFFARNVRDGKAQDLSIHVSDLLVRESDLIGIASTESNLPPYMDPYSAFYAEELEIAIKAHEAILLNGEGNKHHPIGTRVETWLVKNYREKTKSDAFTNRIKTVVLPKKANLK